MNIYEVQKYIEALAEIVESPIGVADFDGNVISCTDSFFNTEIPFQVKRGVTSCRINNADGYLYAYFDVQDSEYILFARKTEKANVTVFKIILNDILRITVNQMSGIGIPHYFRSILLGDMDYNDVVKLSAELEVDFNSERYVMLIETNEEDLSLAMQLMEEITKSTLSAVLIGLNERITAFVCQYENDAACSDFAWLIINTLAGEGLIKAVAVAGNIVNNVTELKLSYETALMMLRYQKGSYDRKQVLVYNSMGVGRLTGMIPWVTAERYMNEVLPMAKYTELGVEYINTIIVFFMNNLNLSETARKLFIHRNTLVYRIEKIHKITGLDITVFEDAVELNLALRLISIYRG